MRYYATILVEQTYEVEADTPEQAENYFRARGADNQTHLVTSSADWDSLTIEEV